VPRQWDRECGKGSTGSVFSFFRTAQGAQACGWELGAGPRLGDPLAKHAVQVVYLEVPAAQGRGV
jgi:hypothetical protein